MFRKGIVLDEVCIGLKTLVKKRYFSFQHKSAANLRTFTSTVVSSIATTINAVAKLSMVA